MNYYWRSISGSPGFIFVFIIIICLAHGLSAQKPERGYYYFPIRPGEINSLSGTMGEIRASHFHAGIDIRTGGVEGLPVYASADGYISRIRVSTGGYGNALYIQHPNSTTTVYAHLLNFRDDIAAYVREKQYEKKSFEIELFPEKNELLVNRTEMIGLSGNSGSSGGPHLHFEIRDRHQDVLNPLHFGFDEVRDNLPPTVDRFAIVPLNADSRVNHQFLRHEYSLNRNRNTYTINQPITAYGSIGLQVLAFDRLDGAANRNGVSCVDVYVNGEEVFYFNISRFSFSETRNVLAHIDFKRSQQNGQRFKKLYVANGNEFSCYRAGDNQGRLTIEAGKEYSVTVNLYDAYNNHSKVEFKIVGVEPLAQIRSSDNSSITINKLEREKALLKITATVNPENEGIEVFSNRMVYDVLPSYRINNQGVYFWNANTGLPDSISTPTGMIFPEYQAFVPSGVKYNFTHELMDIDIPNDALFDTLLLSVKQDVRSNQEFFTIGETTDPLRRHIYVTLKPSRNYHLKEKTGVYGVDSRGRFTFYGGEWRGDRIRFGTRDFGRFTILADTVPPKITPAKITPASLSFYITDERSGIKDFQLTVDGEWVLMNYDYKKNLIWSEKLDRTKPFKGEIVLKVTDQSGNENIFKSNL
jgi:hypothetical protein